MAPWPSCWTTYSRQFGAFFIYLIFSYRLHVGGKPPKPPKVKDWMLQSPMASPKDIFQWIYGDPSLAKGSQTSCCDGTRLIPNIFYLASWLNH